MSAPDKHSSDVFAGMSDEELVAWDRDMTPYMGYIAGRDLRAYKYTRHVDSGCTWQVVIDNDSPGQACHDARYFPHLGRWLTSLVPRSHDDSYIYHRCS